MKKMKKTTKGISRNAANHVSQTTQPPSGQTRDMHKRYLSFSFKYFRQEPSQFALDGKDIAYFLKVLNRLTLLSQLAATELRMNGNKTLRCHGIDWDDTAQTCFGIPDEEQIVDKPWQFSISANAHGRVIGFFIDSVFYVVWFDHAHQVYR